MRRSRPRLVPDVQHNLDGYLLHNKQTGSRILVWYSATVDRWYILEKVAKGGWGAEGRWGMDCFNASAADPWNGA